MRKREKMPDMVDPYLHAANGANKVRRVHKCDYQVSFLLVKQHAKLYMTSPGRFMALLWLTYHTVLAYISLVVQSHERGGSAFIV